MAQLIIGFIIAILITFYLFLRKSLQEENLPSMNAPALSLSKGPNPPAISEDASLPAKSEDINLPAGK